MRAINPISPQTYWDSQLKFSQILPEFQSYLARMSEDSARVSQARRFHKVTTGPDPRQWAEWTTGEGAGSLVPVVLHGGYWRALRAEDHRFLVPALLPFGPAVCSIEYRLKPVHSMAQILDDVRAGIAALARSLPEAHFLVIGHSAGAHLALKAVEDPECARRVSGIIALSGVYDLAPVAQSSLQAEIGFTPQEIQTFSIPPSAKRPPTLFVNGAEETHELIRGSCLMAAQGRSQMVLLPEANHMTLTWQAAAQMEQLVALWRAL